MSQCEGEGELGVHVEAPHLVAGHLPHLYEPAVEAGHLPPVPERAFQNVFIKTLIKTIIGQHQIHF